jgi:hypothetical protein
VQNPMSLIEELRAKLNRAFIRVKQSILKGKYQKKTWILK